MSYASKRCTYCNKESNSLKGIPAKYLVDKRNKYCPKCYPEVLKSVKNFPWNKDK